MGDMILKSLVFILTIRWDSQQEKKGALGTAKKKPGPTTEFLGALGVELEPK